MSPFFFSSCREFKTGEPSQNLEYFNGVLNLTYTHGEAYHDAVGTPRETEIAFVCDPEAGAGTPEFLAERNHTYSFKWLTAFACPTQPIECVAEDENGKQYDLSRCVLHVPNGSVAEVRRSRCKRNNM